MEKDIYCSINSMRWSDNETDDKRNPAEQIPAGPEWMPDRNLLESEEPSTDEPMEDQVLPSDCTFNQRLECLQDMLKMFRNKFRDDRTCLCWIGRYLFRLKYDEMEKIFRLDKSGINRACLQADKEINGKG